MGLPETTAPPEQAAGAALSRRGAVGAFLGGIGLAALGGLATAAPAEAAGDDPVVRLLRRTTYGPTPGLIETVRRSGTKAWLDNQLSPKERVSDTAMNSLLKRWPLLELNSWQAREQLDSGAWEIMSDLVDAHIARAIWSKRQLLEVMVDFWSNHLNITCPSSEVWDNRHLFDKQVIRANALGRFDTMLIAAAKHPAMLRYLGNADSDKDNPNENQGRELLELHSVGIDAGYTEDDMRNSTLILTGLSVDNEGGTYEYMPWRHYVGTVKVLGFTHANTSPGGGEAVVDAYCRYLAHHPATARHIATKLAVRFVGDNPPGSLVTKLAQTYLDNDTAIKPVLRKLFASPSFNDPDRTKTRTPFEDLIATLRALRYQPADSGTDGIRSLQWMSHDVGQPPLAWPLPNGYSDVAVGWSSTSTTLERWNMHLSLAAQWWPDDLVAPTTRDLLPATLPATYGELVDALAAVLGVPRLSSDQRKAVAKFVDHVPGDVLHSSDAAANWRLPYLAALVLNSPRHGRR